MVDGFRTVLDVILRDPAFAKIHEIMKLQETVNKFGVIFPHLNGSVFAVKIKKGTLTLAVENPVLRSELKFHETDIINGINNYFKEERVTKIKFQS